MGGGAKASGPDPTPIDEELRRAGGFGRFQLYITVVTVTGIMSLNLLTHGIGLLERPPQEPDGYICTYESGD